MNGERKPQRNPGRLRLRTLISIRWAAVLGQSVAIVLVHYGLSYSLPIVQCIAAISAFPRATGTSKCWAPCTRSS